MVRCPAPSAPTPPGANPPVIPPPEDPTFPPPPEPDPPDPPPPVDPPPDPPNEYENVALEFWRESDEIIAEVISAPVPPTDPIPPEEPPPPEPEIPPDPPEEPPPGGIEFHRVIENQTINSDTTIPAGEKWHFKGHNKLVRAHLLVDGILSMRPGDTLEFMGGIPDEYRGGGMTFGPGLELDFGLWVRDTGSLDLRGTPKLSWNRTGVHDTWGASDEYYVAPTAVGDTVVRRWFPGDPIPQVTSTVPPTEVANTTRDVIIKGVGHIHIHSHVPQLAEYVRFEGLGVSNLASGGAVQGRYVWHQHHGFDGAAGSLIRGCAAVNCKGRVFVPHLSHGTSFIDNVVVNSYGEGFWWDHGDPTDDVLVERLAVLGVAMPSEVSGHFGRAVGVNLGGGENMTMRDCVVAGVMAATPGVGFDWPEPTALFDLMPNLVWVFDRGNVAHNNRGSGLRFWTNRVEDHVVRNFISYRNSAGGIENGAYLMATRYFNVLSYQDGYLFDNDVSTTRAALGWNGNGGISPTFETTGVTDARFVSLEGEALVIGHRQIAYQAQALFTNVTLEPAAGMPAVRVLAPIAETNPWNGKFVNCFKGLVPLHHSDIVFDSLSGGNAESHVEIRDAFGAGWDIDIIGGAKVITPI